MRHILLLVALLCSAPALAQRGANNGTVGATISPVATSSRVGTTDWRWMTSGIRAGEALWHNFWRGEHGGGVQRGTFGREVRAGVFHHHQFGQELRGGTPDILTGASQRIDILTGRLID
jgi:hypothetical protein